MPTEELRAIEIILNNLTTTSTQTPDILASDEDSFNNSKLYLFNRVTINRILNHSKHNPVFPTKTFLENGTIPEVYTTSISAPDTEETYQNHDFYKILINALKNNEYNFDKEGNININNSELNTVINPIWLHRLAEYLKLIKYNKVFIFNKNKNAKIYDEETLMDYLNKTKTFQVTLDKKNDCDVEDIYNVTRKKTTNTVSQKKQSKVDDIINTFIRYAPKELNPTITKFIMPSPIYIIKKANEIGMEFYNASLSKQQKMISEWLEEYLEYNELAAISLQKTLLIKEQKDISQIPFEEKQKSICGLTSILFTILNYSGLDYDTVSLSDFQIDTYLSDQHQDTQIALNEIITIIEGVETSPLITKTKKQISELMDEINLLDASKNKEELERKQTLINNLFSKYKKIELEKEQLIEKRNSLQNILYYHKTHDIDDVRFDNTKIGDLLKQSAIDGQIIINPLDNKKISVKLLNSKTGRITFEVNVSVSKLMKFIEDVNFRYEEPEIKMAA